MLIIYMILGYWATGKTLYANKILIGTSRGIFYRRFMMGFFLGWFLIPWAVLKMIFGRR